MSNGAIVPSNLTPSNRQQFTFNGHLLDALTDQDGTIWFHAADVCACCELDNVSQAVSRLDEDEKTILILNDNGRPQKILLVNEPGLYALIGGSRKPGIKPFKRWVNHEVLPALRKSGTYSVKTMTQAQINLANAQVQVDLEERLTKLEMQVDRKLGDVALSVEKVNDRLDDREFMSIETWCNQQGIKKSVALRIKWGKSCADLSRQKGTGFKKSIDEPHAPNRYHVSILQSVCIPTSTTPKRQLELPEGDNS